MPKIKVLPSVLPLPHDQHFYSVVGDNGSLRGPFGPFSLNELRQEFSTMGLGPSDIQNFLDQIGAAGNSLELEIPTQ